MDPRIKSAGVRSVLNVRKDAEKFLRALRALSGDSYLNLTPPSRMIPSGTGFSPSSFAVKPNGHGL
jgi:hypothetical protein